MIYWKSEDPSTIWEWIHNTGEVLRMEKLIYQHKGSTLIYERLWAPWLDVLGLAPGDLIMDRLLGLNPA